MQCYTDLHLTLSKLFVALTDNDVRLLWAALMFMVHSSHYHLYLRGSVASVSSDLACQRFHSATGSDYRTRFREPSSETGLSLSSV